MISPKWPYDTPLPKFNSELTPEKCWLVVGDDVLSFWVPVRFQGPC